MKGISMKIIINEAQFKAVTKVLAESVSDKVYHFTYTPIVLNILKTNQIYLSPSFGIGADNNVNYNKTFSLSLTTSKSSKVGYGSSRGSNGLVRIEFNGRELNYNYKSKHIDYWQYKRTPEFMKQESGNEMEERILSNKNTIAPATRYITKIDILNKDGFNTNGIDGQIKTLADSLNVPCYFYTDVNSFNYEIIKNAVNPPQVGETEPEEDAGNNTFSYMAKELAALISYKDDKMRQKILSYTDKQGIDNAFVNTEIDKKLQNLVYNYFAQDDLGTLSQLIASTIGNNRATTNTLNRFFIHAFASDMKKHNCKTILDYLKYKYYIGKKTQKQFNEEFYNEITKIIDKEFVYRSNILNGLSFYTIDGEYVDGNILQEIPDVKTGLLRIVNNIKEYCANYILNNNDMFRYPYELSSYDIRDNLQLKSIDYFFSKDLIDYDSSTYTGRDAQDVISYIVYAINDAYPKIIERLQAEYRAQSRNN